MARAGARSDAERVLAAVINEGRESSSREATLLALGRHEEWLTTLEAGTISAYSVERIYFWPVFDPVRTDPRFVRMLATLGMTEAHGRARAWRAKNATSKAAKQ